MKRILLLISLIIAGCNQSYEPTTPETKNEFLNNCLPPGSEIIKVDWEDLNNIWIKFSVCDDNVKRTFLMHRWGKFDHRTESLVLLSTDELDAEEIK